MNIPVSKKVFINADDYAESAEIDAAVIDLAKRHIIHGTSALVLSPHWPDSAKKLNDLPIQVGLHLDLTSRFNGLFHGSNALSHLITRAYLRSLNPKKLEATIELQWDRFTEFSGKAPDFIDGHQHVHQLPVVREALFAVIRKKNWGRQPHQWIRICHSARWRGFKAGLISLLGANKTRHMAKQHGIRTNTDFAGVYNFDANSQLANLWQSWLSGLQGTPVIMCHIAIEQENPTSDSVQDPIYAARVAEYHWLLSPKFQTSLLNKVF